MFKKIKENWKKKIERNAFKSILTYINREGIKMLNEGTPIENLPEDTKVTETVYIKRSLLPLGDWARIYPPIKENGKIDLINLIFGGKKNLVKLIIILGILGMFFVQFYDNFQEIKRLTAIVSNCNLRGLL